MHLQLSTMEWMVDGGRRMEDGVLDVGAHHHLLLHLLPFFHPPKGVLIDCSGLSGPTIANGTCCRLRPPNPQEFNGKKGRNGENKSENKTHLRGPFHSVSQQKPDDKRITCAHCLKSYFKVTII